MRRPLASCCRIRSASVLVPRSASQQSNGPGTAPDAFWIKPIRSATSSAFTTSMPPTMSLWPFKYLAVGAAVHVLTAHDVVTLRQQLEHCVHGREPGGERKPVTTAFQRGDVPLERFAGRVLRAGVLVAFVLPETLLDVGRGLIDRRH